MAILSIIVTIIVFFKSKKERKPVFHLKNITLIQEDVYSLKNLKILFQDKEIKNLTLTRIALWNKGKETINKSDVAPTDQIRISLEKDFEILDANITYIKQEANNFSIRIDEVRKDIFIEFDYFHFLEGIVIQFYHTGANEDEIKILGTIKTTGKFRKGILPKNFITGRIIEYPFKILKIKNIIIFNVVLIIWLLLFMPILIIAGVIEIIYTAKRKSIEFSLGD